MELVNLGLKDNAGIQKVLVLDLPDTEAQTGWGVSRNDLWVGEKLTSWDWSAVAKILALGKGKAYRLAEDLSVPKGFTQDNAPGFREYTELLWVFMPNGFRALREGFCEDLPPKRYRSLEELVTEIDYQSFLVQSAVVSLNQGQLVASLRLPKTSRVFIPQTNWDLRTLGHMHHNCIYSRLESILQGSSVVLEVKMPFGSCCVEIYKSRRLIEVKLPYNKPLDLSQEEELIAELELYFLMEDGGISVTGSNEEKGYLPAVPLPYILMQREIRVCYPQHPEAKALAQEGWAEAVPLPYQRVGNKLRVQFAETHPCFRALTEAGWAGAVPIRDNTLFTPNAMMVCYREVKQLLEPIIDHSNLSQILEGVWEENVIPFSFPFNQGRALGLLYFEYMVVSVFEVAPRGHVLKGAEEETYEAVTASLADYVRNSEDYLVSSVFVFE
jgi:hypothetical protein